MEYCPECIRHRDPMTIKIWWRSKGNNYSSLIRRFAFNNLLMMTKTTKTAAKSIMALDERHCYHSLRLRTKCLIIKCAILWLLLMAMYSFDMSARAPVHQLNWLNCNGSTTFQTGSLTESILKNKNPFECQNVCQNMNFMRSGNEITVLHNSHSARIRETQ